MEEAALLAHSVRRFVFYLQVAGDKIGDSNKINNKEMLSAVRVSGQIGLPQGMRPINSLHYLEGLTRSDTFRWVAGVGHTNSPAWTTSGNTSQS